MFLTGNLFATSDLGVVDTAARNGYKLLYIGDSMEMPREYKFIDAIAFTPDYQSMMAAIGNDIPRFQELYSRNLNQPSSQELMAIILKALRQGTNIMMYFPQDSLQLQYPAFLLQYFENALGIQTGTDMIPPAYNENYNLSNLRLMYIFRLIGWKEFLLVCEDVDPIVMGRFREDICPAFGINPSISDFDMMNEIEKIKKNLQDQLNKPRLFTRIEATA